MGEDEEGFDEHSPDDFTPERFEALAGLNEEALDPLAGFQFDPLAGLNEEALDPLAGFDSKTFESHISSEVSQQAATINGESTLSSEIQSFLTQAQGQLAYQRTYEALTAVGEHIDDKYLLFVAGSIITTLPRFLPTEPAIAAAVIGNSLAIYHYVLDRQD